MIGQWMHSKMSVQNCALRWSCYSCFAASDALVIGARPAVKRVAVRAQEAPSPPPKGRLGATVDQDGKSNVWVRARRP